MKLRSSVKSQRYRIVLLVSVLLLVLVRTTQGQKTLDRHEYRQTHMGMPVRIVLYAPNDTTARAAARAAYRKIETLEDKMSRYRSSSELNRLSGQSGNPVHVSAPLFAVLQQAQTLSRQSDGAFDVTSGPYIKLWEEVQRTGELPDSSALQTASSRVGWKHVRLQETEQTVHLRADSMQLNLGGIAKGFILDRALDVLIQRELSRAMVEAGGDLVVGTAPPNQDGWHVQLPGIASDSTSRTRSLTNAAVSTSGDTHQFVEIDGTRYSHIVDPRTGMGLTHGLLVSIVAGDGATADALATTVSVLGSEEGRAFLNRHYPGVTAYIRDGNALRSHD